MIYGAIYHVYLLYLSSHQLPSTFNDLLTNLLWTDRLANLFPLIYFNYTLADLHSISPQSQRMILIYLLMDNQLLCIHLPLADFFQLSGGLGGQVVRPLAAHAKGPGFNSPITPHVQRLISGLYVWCGWFTGTKLALGPTIWVHFLPVPLYSIV